MKGEGEGMEEDGWCGGVRVDGWMELVWIRINVWG